MSNQTIRVEAMTRDLVDCTFETFAHHYLPKPNEGLVDTVLAALVTVGVLEKRPMHCDLSSTSPSSGKFAQFSEHFFATGLKQTTAHGLFADTAEKIMDILALETKSHLGEDRRSPPPDEPYKHRLFSRSNRRLASVATKSDCRVDACLLGSSNDAGVGCHQILIPFLIHSTEGNDVVQIREELLLTANLIMNGDARRMFLYGITIESDRVSVWYFSRNHSVKADSFSFVKHPERLIHLFVSLFSANDEALGLDPNIVLYPKESSGNPSYIYRFSNGSVDECRLFKSTEAIGDHTGSLRVSGHTTRVWKAVEVANIDGDPLTGTGDGMKAEGVVIKDVWIDATAETEKEIQDKIFKSINEFVESPEPWKGHPCLAKFTPLQFADLESLIVDKQYRKCFLRIRETHQSQPSKAVAKDSWMHDDPFTVSETPQTAIPPQLPSTLGATNLVQSAPDNVNGRIEARYPPKKRCFFMFDEICTRVSHLPTFGDAVDILRQTYTVLLLMFCAGWIHRDISTGNILAMEGKQGKWLLKLADLEYAEPFPATVPPGRENWRIGTPFFMATELQRGHYFTLTKAAEDQDPSYLETEVQNSSADPETNVVHNLQHDLESLWWIGFYLGTVKVGPNLQSALWCRDMGIFCGHLEANPDSRHQLLLRGFPKELQETFHPGLKTFMALWRKLGNNMMASYQRRSPGDVTDKSTYAHISWHFVTFLDALEDSRNQWGPVPLLIPGARESKKRARREKAEEEEDDKGVRSHADPSRTSDIGPSMKRPRVSDNEL